MAGDNERRIMLLGKTGLGKSSTGNTILNRRLFEAYTGANSVTHEARKGETRINGRNIAVIDTPGFCDTHIIEEETRRALVTSFAHCAPGPHAFLIVLKVQRYTGEEKRAIQLIRQMFGEKVLRYAIVLFTHLDQLQKDGRTIEQFVNESECLINLIQKCGGRYHAFNNDDMADRTQVEDLLRKIDDMVRRKGGRRYTKAAVRAIPQLRDEEDMRRFIRELLVALAGLSTGAIIGAFFGVVIGFKAGVLLPSAVAVRATERITEEVADYAVNMVKASIGVPVAVKCTSPDQFGTPLPSDSVPDASSAPSLTEIPIKPAVKVIGVAALVLAVGGGVLGGVEGLSAASGAESMEEACQKAQNAVCQKAGSYSTAVERLANIIAYGHGTSN